MTALRSFERIGIRYQAANAVRPAAVRLVGWLGGSFTTTDPAQLDQQAALITAAANALRAQQRAEAGHHEPDQPTLFDRTSAA